MSMDATDLRDAVRPMGLPSAIAASAAAEFRGRRFSGRHPVVAFVLLPIVSLPLTWAASIATILAIAKVLGIESGGPATAGPIADWANWCLPAVVFGTMVVPVVFSAAFFCRLATRAAIGWKWPIGACAILAVFGGLAIIQVVLPTAAHQGQLRFGFGVSQNPSLSQIVQFAVPLAIGGWFAWRQIGPRSDVYAS